MPSSGFKTFWNTITICLLIYTGTYVPFKTAFIQNSSKIVDNMELGIDCLFIIDIIINFISAYEDKEKNIIF
jgi:hypothetical protein